MNVETAGEALGESGLVGVALLVVGILIIGRENRRAAIGAVALVAGYSLVARGLVGSVLESMGMGYGDLV